MASAISTPRRRRHTFDTKARFLLALLAAAVFAAPAGAALIYTPNWYARREVAFGPAVAWVDVEPRADPEWLVWDVTDPVADWVSGGSENNGILVKLVDEQQDVGLGGPAVPSSSYPDPEVRPRLVVWLTS